MRNLCFIAACVACSVAFSEDRLRVSDNSAETSVKDAIKATARAFDTEDVRAYELCFKESRRPSVRRKAALIFADSKCSMEILDVHVIEVAESSASAAVKYKMAGIGQPTEVLSEISMIRESDKWVIEKETVRSSSVARSAENSELAGGVQRGEVLFAPAGRKVVAMPGEWDQFDPDLDRISPNLKHLSGDIGIREGFGCANGRCANGRCEVR